jgi:hypothetical protein
VTGHERLHIRPSPKTEALRSCGCPAHTLNDRQGSKRPTNWLASFAVSPKVRVAAAAATLATKSALDVAQQRVGRHRVVVDIGKIVGWLAPLPEGAMLPFATDSPSRTSHQMNRSRRAAPSPPRARQPSPSGTSRSSCSASARRAPARCCGDSGSSTTPARRSWGARRRPGSELHPAGTGRSQSFRLGQRACLHLTRRARRGRSRCSRIIQIGAPWRPR